jgi:PAS domain S-box-containing protein
MRRQDGQKIAKFAGPNMILVGILLGLSFWFIDPLIGSFILSDEPFWRQALDPSSEEIWLRSFVTFLFIVFGFLVERVYSKRREAEKALRENEERLRQIIARAPFGAHLYKLEAGNRLILTGANEAADKILNLSHAALVGKTLEEAFPGLAGTPLPNIYRKLCANGGSWDDDQVSYSGDDFQGIYDVHAFNTGVDSMAVFFADITERRRAEEALRRSEARFRQLADLLPESVFEADVEGNITYVNQHALKIFQYAAEDAVYGANIFNLILPEHKERARANFSRLLQGELSINHEYTAIRKDGSTFEVAIYCAPIIQNGKASGIRGIVIDITERKRAEIELRKSEERFRTIADYTHDWENWHDPEGKLLWINPSVERISGYTPEECLSMSDFPIPLVLDEDIGIVREIFARAHEGMGGDDFPFRIKRKDNRIIWVTCSWQPIFDSAGGNLGVRTSIRDISKRKKAEEALRASENSYRTLAENLPGIVFRIVFKANDYKIHFFNNMLESLTGYSPEELGLHETNSIIPLIAEEDKPGTIAAIEKAICDRKAFVVEYRIRHKDGSVRYFATRGRAIYDEEGKPLSVDGVTFDVTERKDAESALRQSENFLRTVFNGIQDGISVLDKNLNILRVNAAMENWYSHKMPLVGKKCYDAYQQRDRHCDICPSLRAIETGRSQMEEVPLMGKDGEEGWLELYSFPIFDDSGACTGVIEYVRNITDRKRAEISLRAKEEQISSIFRVAPVGIGIVAGNRVLKEFNEAVCQMTGYSREELLDHSARVLYPDDAEYERVGREKYGQIAKYGSGSVESVWRKKNGELIDVIISSTPIDPNDLSRGITFTALDITERKQAEKALMASERRYRVISEQTGQMVYDWDVRTGQIYWAGAIKHITGYEPEEYQKVDIKLWEEMIHPEDRELAVDLLQKAMDSLTPYQVEYRLRKNNGSYVYVEDNGVFLKDENGEVYRMLGTMKDITDRRKARESLVENELKYRTLFETSVDGVFLMTDIFFDCNEQACRLWACDREDIVGHSPVEFSPKYQPDGRLSEESAAEKIRAALAGATQKFYWQHKRKDDKLIDTEVTLKAITLNGQTILQASVHDITEQKKAQEEIAAERERLAVTLRSIGDGVISADTDGKIVMLNEVAEKLTGWKNEEALGRPLDEVFRIVSETTRERVANPVFKALSIGDSIELDMNTILISRDGREIPIADSAAPIKDAKGTAIGVVLVFRDITEKRKIEEELSKASKIESLGIFAGGIAHDFNNILTSIMGNISLAKMNIGENHDIHGMLADAEKASVRAQELTYQLLTFAKGGAPAKRTAAVDQIIRECAGLCLRGSKSRCEFEFDENLRPVDMDCGQISQALNNLIINSNQAMPDGGVITIAARNVSGHSLNHPIIKTGEWVKISITDRGPGIPEQHIDRIFDPFFTTKQKGSGLGLAITYSVIRRHDGYIEVESTSPQGTTISVFLPASNEELSPELKDDNPFLTRGEGTILLMDDDEGVLSVINMALSRLGYKTVLARDGREAINKYKQAINSGERFDVVIMDLTIPGGMGGKETIALLREIDPDVKAIVSSGYSNDPIISEYEKYGFSGCVCKPYKASQLGAALQAVLSRPGQPTPKP